ncbi:MAG: phage holin family protein [Reichenbachiella sp.]
MADFFSISRIKETFSDYLKVKFELFKLDISEHIANVLAQVIAYVVILLMATLVLGFTSIGISFWLNELFESNYLGFLLTAGFYLFILIIVFIFLKSGKLKSLFENMLIGSMDVEEKKGEKNGKG